jgi:hypothetical protein
MLKKYYRLIFDRSNKDIRHICVDICVHTYVHVHMSGHTHGHTCIYNNIQYEWTPSSLKITF